MEITQPIVAVIQLATQPRGVIHQVILHPDKIKHNGKRSTDAIIRLGEFPGDEINGWQPLVNIQVIQILGQAVYDELTKAWKCVPIVKSEDAVESSPAPTV
jgi:hypothetical protein